jgi:hypothetical protein
MENNGMNTKDCKSYEGCDAPICPMDDATKNIATWFADEEICGSLQFRKEKWRISQRRIAKRATDRDSYYTMAMLNAIDQVRTGIKGVVETSILFVDRESDKQASFIASRVGGKSTACQFGDGMPREALK